MILIYSKRNAKTIQDVTCHLQDWQNPVLIKKVVRDHTHSPSYPAHACENKLGQALSSAIWRHLFKLHMHSASDPTMSLLGIYPEKQYLKVKEFLQNQHA